MYFMKRDFGTYLLATQIRDVDQRALGLSAGTHSQSIDLYWFLIDCQICCSMEQHGVWLKVGLVIVSILFKRILQPIDGQIVSRSSDLTISLWEIVRKVF